MHSSWWRQAWPGLLRKGMCAWPFFNMDKESPHVRRHTGNWYAEGCSSVFHWGWFPNTADHFLTPSAQSVSSVSLLCFILLGAYLTLRWKGLSFLFSAFSKKYYLVVKRKVKALNKMNHPSRVLAGIQPGNIQHCVGGGFRHYCRLVNLKVYQVPQWFIVLEDRILQLRKVITGQLFYLL